MRADRRRPKRLPGIPSPQEELHPSRLGALRIWPATAAGRQGELPRFDGKAPVADHGILLAVPDADAHDGTWRQLHGLEWNSRFGVAIAIDVGGAMPWHVGDVDPADRLRQHLGASHGDDHCHGER